MSIPAADPTGFQFFTQLFYASPDTPRKAIEIMTRRSFLRYPKNTLALLLRTRDCKGKGLREQSLWAISEVQKIAPLTVSANLSALVNVGCYRDLCVLYKYDYRRRQDTADISPLRHLANAVARGVPLACKWAPSESTHFDLPYNGSQAKKMMMLLGMTPKEYRCALKRGRSEAQIVETKMCSGNWESIECGDVPSRALRTYSASAFPRHGIEHNHPRTGIPGMIPRSMAIDDEIAWSTFVAFQRTLGKYGRTVVCAHTSENSSNEVSAGTTVSDIATTFATVIASCCSFGHSKLILTHRENPTVVEVAEGNVSGRSERIRRMQSDDRVDCYKLLLILCRYCRSIGVPPALMPETIFVVSGTPYDFSYSPHASVRGEFLLEELPKIVYWHVRKGPTCVREVDEKVTCISGSNIELVSYMWQNGSTNPSSVGMINFAISKFNPVMVTDGRNEVPL